MRTAFSPQSTRGYRGKGIAPDTEIDMLMVQFSKAINLKELLDYEYLKISLKYRNILKFIGFSFIFLPKVS